MFSGISEIADGYLTIAIPEWLAGMLRIDVGTVVPVGKKGGKFNIQPIDPLPLQ